MDRIWEIFSFCYSVAVIFGGLLPYVPQYLKIKSSQSTEGFSTYVCLTLLIANILRILFWFGLRFDLALLIQSFVMIAGMLVIMELCIRVKKKKDNINQSSVAVAKLAIHSISNGLGRDKSDSDNNLDANIHSNESSNINTSNQKIPAVYSVLYSNHHKSISTEPHGDETIKSGFSEENNETNQVKLTPDSVSHELMDIGLISDSSENKSDCQPVSSSSSRLQLTNRESRVINSPATASQSPLPQSHPVLKYFKGCINEFWRWSDYLSYVKFLLYFTITAAVLTYLLIENRLYIKLLGFAALLTESLLGVPQLIENHEKKSTKGFSNWLLIFWIGGDGFKTFYFILKQAPLQFLICGSIQIVVDVLILCQVLWYKFSKASYWHLPQTNLAHDA